MKDPFKMDNAEGTNRSCNMSEGEPNPNQRLGSVLLNEFNYLPWSRAVSIALGGRSKLGYVNGHIRPPNSSSQAYEAWQCKDQLVMSWLLNSMENHIAEIFSYSESSFELWEAVKEMFGNQNNAARIFQINRNLANLQQDGKTYFQLLGTLKGMWSELALYRPHTIDAAELRKREEEDKIFQLLASLGSDYEDLRSRILMNPDLPSLTSVCATIQREEVRTKVMNSDSKNSLSESRAYVVNRSMNNDRPFKGKRTELKCHHCHNIGHSIGRCWILYPELKPDFEKKKRSQRSYDTKSHVAAAHFTGTSSSNIENFSTNPSALLNEFAAYLKEKGDTAMTASASDSVALLGKFAGFLANSAHLSQENTEGIFTAFKTALVASTVHDFWVIDSGATDHITNKMTSLCNFEGFSSPTHVSIANGKHVSVKGKGKIKLMSNSIESSILYVPSFPFQLLSIGKITRTLNCRAIFDSQQVLFQDLATKKTIGEGFFFKGLYYFSSHP